MTATAGSVWEKGLLILEISTLYYSKEGQKMQSAFFFIPFFGSWRKGLFMAYVRNKKKILKFWSKKKAALYVRVSTRYQVDKDSLPFQRKKLKEYCKFLGIEGFVIFEDDGYSAKNTDRPYFRRFLL